MNEQLLSMSFEALINHFGTKNELVGHCWNTSRSEAIRHISDLAPIKAEIMRRFDERVLKNE